MRKILIISLISGLLFPAIDTYSQLEVKTDGTVKIGPTFFDSGDKDLCVVNPIATSNSHAYSAFRLDNVNNHLYLNRYNTNYRNEIVFYSYGIDQWHVGLNDTDVEYGSSQNSFFIGPNHSGQNPYMWFDHSHQCIGLFTSTPSTSYELTLNGNAKITAQGGQWIDSDIAFKQNINKVESAIDKLLSIRGVTYEITDEYLALMNPDTTAGFDSNQNRSFDESTSVGFGKNDTASVTQYQSETRQAIPFSTKKYGVIAQEVLEQFPDLVHKEYDGYYAVNYTGLIPVLIEAIKEQQAVIEDIQSELDNLSRSELKSISTDIVDEVSSDTPILYQNSPNPFTQNTTITYYIPDYSKKSMLCIYDLNGTQLRSYQISRTGHGEQIIYGNDFSPGMYIYSLMVDGQLIDTKQMVITD
ncbi:MAG TPA: tail fiber domain-containing protein [Bacteroidales bacterium]|nr:tail fiber domain-containing protein [Bacteroidales bacterium]